MNSQNFHEPPSLLEKRLAFTAPGFVFIDKPLEKTSFFATRCIKKKLGARKAGHIGTLDPLATGLLPIALNGATRLINAVVAREKRYQFTISWGAETSTCDRQGEVIKTSPVRITRAHLEQIIHDHFTGDITQIPPAFSALKIQGKPAYTYARLGQEVTLPARTVTLANWKIIDHHKEESTLAVTCSKGTYIRSLARDIAAQSQSCGHVSFLRRLQMGKFSCASTLPLDRFQEFGHNGDMSGFVTPIEDVLDDIPVICFSEEQAGKLKQGMDISFKADAADEARFFCRYQDGASHDRERKFSVFALAVYREGRLFPVHVFSF